MFSPTNQPKADTFVSTSKAKPKKESFWDKPKNIGMAIGAGVVVALFAAAGIKMHKVNKTFEKTVSKIYDDVLSDISAVYKKQGLDIVKPEVKYIDEFTGVDKSQLAHYEPFSNIIRVNKGKYMQDTYAVVSKNEKRVKMCFGETELKKYMKGKNSADFKTKLLTAKEKEIALYSTVSHELEHAAQYQAMLNFDKEATINAYKKGKNVKSEFLDNFKPTEPGKNIVFDYGDSLVRNQTKNGMQMHLGYDAKTLLSGMQKYARDKDTYLMAPIEIGARLRSLGMVENKFGKLSDIPLHVRAVPVNGVINDVIDGVAKTDYKPFILDSGKLKEFAPGKYEVFMGFGKN